MKTSRTISRLIGRVITELLIVIVGVFIAFQLSSYKENQLTKEQKKTFFEAFVMEMQSLEQNSQLMSQFLNKAIVDLKDPELQQNLLKSGFKYLRYTNEMLLIRSAYDEAYTTLIGAKFLIALENGHSLILTIEAEKNRFIQNYNSVFKSGQTLPSQCFTKNGNLKPEYEWIPEDLNHILKLYEQLIIAINDGAIPETKMILEKL